MKFPVFLFLVFTSFVASLGEAKTLRWEDCVRLTQENNPALKASVSSVRASENQSAASRSGLFPQISSSLGYNYTNNQNAAKGSNSYSASVTANQNLFNGFSDLAKMEQAQASEAIAAANLRSTKAQISYSLKVAFAALKSAESAESLANDIANRRELNLSLVQLRFRNGHENKGSVLLYQAYLRDAKLNQLQNRNAVATAKLQLAELLGLNGAEGLSVSGDVPLQVPQNPGKDLLNLAEAVPSYVISVQQERSAEASLRSAKSGFYPTLGVTGTFSKNGDQWFPQTRQWSVGGTLTVPIFNGGRDYFGTKAAIESLSAAASAQKESLSQALTALQQAQATFVESVEQVNVDLAYLEAAQVRAEIARANYKNGTLSFQDWDLVETDLINRQKTLLNGKKARIVAEAAWEQAQGTGVFP